MEPGKLLKKVGKGVGTVASTIVDVAGGAAEVAGTVVGKGRSMVPGIGSAPRKRTRKAATRGTGSTAAKPTAAKSTAAKQPATATKATSKTSGARTSASKATPGRRTKTPGTKQLAPRKRSTQGSSE